MKLTGDHLSDKENIFPVSSVCEYLGWLKPNTDGEGQADALFMFSNGLLYEKPWYVSYQHPPV